MALKKNLIDPNQYDNLLVYIKKKVLIFAKDQLFYRKDGTPQMDRNGYIFDFRRMFLDSEGINLITKAFWDTYETQYPFQLAAIELGSVPLLWALILEWRQRGKNTNALIVRSSRKKKWLGNIIEGIPTGERILLIDDLINSGGSMLQAITILEDNGLPVWKTFCVLNMESQKLPAILESQYPHLTFEYFLKKSEILADRIIKSADLQIAKWALPRITIMQLPRPNKVHVVPKSSPLITKEALYVAGEGAKIFRIDRDTFIPRWEFTLTPTRDHQKNILSTPKDLGDSIALGSYDGSLYILDKETGKETAFASVAEWVGSSPDYSKKHNLLYVGVENTGEKKWGLIAVEKTTGDFVWIQEFDDHTHGSPIYIEEFDCVICGSNCGTVGCFDAKTGEERWKIMFDGPIKWGMAYLPSRKAVVFGGFDYYVRAVSVENGGKLWEFKTEHRIYSTPLIVDNEIFIGSVDKKAYHLDSHGNKLWEVSTKGRIFAAFTPFGERLIVMPSNDMKIYFYDRIEKRVVWYAQHSERITTKPAIFENTMYISDFMNRVYAFDLTEIANYPNTPSRIPE